MQVKAIVPRGSAVRWLAAALAGLLILGLLADPYTFRASGSDNWVFAPWWQILLATVDIALVIHVGICIWRGLQYHALIGLAVETIYNLSLNVLHVQRHGFSRFVMGIGAEEFLTCYFISLVIRLLIILGLAYALFSARNRVVDHVVRR